MQQDDGGTSVQFGHQWSESVVAEVVSAAVGHQHDTGGAEFVEGPGQASAVARRVAFRDRSGGDAVGACHRCSRRGGAVERLQARIRYRGVEFGQHSGYPDRPGALAVDDDGIPPSKG